MVFICRDWKSQKNVLNKIEKISCESINQDKLVRNRLEVTTEEENNTKYKQNGSITKKPNQCITNWAKRIWRLPTLPA